MGRNLFYVKKGPDFTPARWLNSIKKTGGLLLTDFQRLLDIGNDIVNMFDAYRYADQVG